jgi:hypothetical protein
MKILNATKMTMSIMDEKNELITAEPGQFSNNFVPNRNLILSVTRLGSPEEVGMVIRSSAELAIAGEVSVSDAYIYPTEEAVITALVDKKGNSQESLTKFELESIELGRARGMIELLNKEVGELKKKIDDNPANSQAVKEMTEKVNNLEAERKDLIDKVNALSGYKSKFEDLKRDVKENYVLKSEV